MIKNLIHLVVVIVVVLAGMTVAHAGDHGRVLYVGNEKGICEKIGAFVDVCRERDIPKDMPAMMVLQKYASYTKDKKDFAVVVDEAVFHSRSYNPSGLIMTAAAIVVGGGFAQGDIIGNKNPFGEQVTKGADAGFAITDNGEKREVRCADMPYPECRARMLEEIKQKWPKKG